MVHGNEHGIWGGASEQQRRRLRRQPDAARQCRRCGNPFAAVNGSARYCGDDCRYTAQQERQAASERRVSEQGRRHRHSEASRQAAGTSGPSR